MCGTWYIALKEEHRLRVFENGELRRIFGPTGEEMEGEGKYNVNLHNTYATPNRPIIIAVISRWMASVGHTGLIGQLFPSPFLTINQ
jgi:hypothetical protein